MNKQTKPSFAPEKIGVKNIPIDKLKPNPHNPRMLFDRKPLDILKESIEKVGILVPLTVYWAENKGTYVILDGQRRWMCAIDLKFREIPVNQVAEPSRVQNIVTMFQIHKLREDWELMPTALKLEVLMDELKEKNEKKLAELTGLDRAVVSRCKKLLSYPKKYHDLMLDPNPENRVKADFFIELYTVKVDTFVNQMKWFSKNEFTDKTLDRYRKGNGIKAVTDFRIMKQYITSARSGGYEEEITKRLKEFTDNEDLLLDYLNIKSASVTANAQKLISSIKRIEEDIKGLNPQEFYGEESLWIKLENLIKVIQSKLRAAGRR